MSTTVNDNTSVVLDANVNEVNEVANTEVTHANIIKKLIAEGAKKVNNLKIKAVNLTEKENHMMVSFTVNGNIRAYISEDNGETYKEGISNIIYTSLYAIIGILKENEDTAFMAPHILEHPKALQALLTGGTVDLLQYDLPSGTEYKNPFSRNKDVTSLVYDHDTIINIPFGFKLGGIGAKAADKLMDKMLGF